MHDRDVNPQIQHGPWIDVHAHPGACFVHGLAAEDPMRRLFAAGERDERALLRAGEVTVSAYASVADAPVIGLRDNGIATVRDFEPGEALATNTAQVEAIRDLAHAASLDLVLHPDDIERLHSSSARGMWLTCEGGDFVERDTSRVAAAHARGVRSITLVHYRVNDLGDIQTEEPRYHGLTGAGREVIAEMNRLGMVIDLAHATMATTVAAAEASRAPIMVSHSHLASAGADHPRLLSPDHACTVAATGGVIGAWPSGIVAASLADFADEIARLVDLIGIEHVALGTDLDANYRPVLTEHSQLPALAALLRARGFGAGDVDAVLGGNFLRMWRAVVAVAN
jgi:membrane dipeptidase